LGQPDFQQKFGIPYPSQPSGYLLPAVWQSAWIAAAFGAIAAAEVFAGLIMNRTGRRHMLIIGIIFNVIGIVILQVAQNWKVWLVGKMFNSMGFGMMYCMSPVW